MKREKKTRSAAMKISDISGIPPEAFVGISCTEIHISERSEVNISSCEGILLYSQDMVRLRLKEFTMTICGRELVMRSFTDGSVSVCGVLGSIDFGLDEEQQ